MLTVYRAIGSDGSDSDKEKKKVKTGIPAGAETVEKVRGGAALVRYKKDRPFATGIGIMGQTYGFLPATKRKEKEKKKEKRSKSAAPSNPYLYMYPQVVHPEQAYLSHHQDPRPMFFPPNYQQLPMGSAPHPSGVTAADIANLPRFDMHYNTTVALNTTSESKSAKESKEEKEKESKGEKTSTTKRIGHHCAHCGKPRSKKYHIQHPLLPGQESIPGYCRRCQRDASSTSGSSSAKKPRKVKIKKYKHKSKSGKKVHVRFEGYSSHTSHGRSSKRDKYSSDPESHVRRRESKHKKEHYEPSVSTSDEESSDDGRGRGRGRQTQRRQRPRYESEHDDLPPHSRQRSRSIDSYGPQERQFGQGDVVDDTLRLAGSRTSSPLTRTIKVTNTKIRRPVSPHYRSQFRYVEPHNTRPGHPHRRLDGPTEYIEERKAELSEFPWISQARRQDEDELSPIDVTPPRERAYQSENHRLREYERRGVELHSPTRGPRGFVRVRSAQGRTQEEMDAEFFRRRAQEDIRRQEFTREEAEQHYRDDWSGDNNYSDDASPAPQQISARRSNRTDMEGYQHDPYAEYRHAEPRRSTRAPSPAAPAQNQVVHVVLPTIKVQDCEPGGDRGTKRWPPYPVTPEGEQSNRYDDAFERVTSKNVHFEESPTQNRGRPHHLAQASGHPEDYERRIPPNRSSNDSPGNSPRPSRRVSREEVAQAYNHQQRRQRGPFREQMALIQSPT